MYENNMPDLRYRKTQSFLQKNLPAPARIMDLGIDNPFAAIMRKEGYTVDNTGVADLDEQPDVATAAGYDAVTAFEILEHLLAPYALLKTIDAPALLISVPLNVWFAPPHRNANDLRDRHYHEFYPWQMDWLLEKTGWTIQDSEVWTSPDRLRLGIRPLLRFIWPSYYFVYCTRK